jgi:WD40 repeat protein
VWDAVSGREVLTLKGHTDGVNSAAFSPDGKRIVTASGSLGGTEDNTARVWEARAPSGQWREVLTLKGHTKAVNSAAFSPDGQRIVTASGSFRDTLDNTARVWDAVSGRELLTLKGHADEVHSAAFSPDGKRIVTASRDGTARVWISDPDAGN